MKLIVEIKMDNAAFEDAPASETSRILRKLAKTIEDGELIDGGNLRDSNGNKVGTWAVVS